MRKSACGGASGNAGIGFGYCSGGTRRRRRAPSAPGTGRERRLDLLFDEVKGRRERRVYTQLRRVEQEGIGGPAKRGNRAALVGGIASVEFRQKVSLAAVDAEFLEVELAAAGADFGPGIELQLGRGIRTNDSGDIA